MLRHVQYLFDNVIHLLDRQRDTPPRFYFIIQVIVDLVYGKLLCIFVVPELDFFMVFKDRSDGQGRIGCGGFDFFFTQLVLLEKRLQNAVIGHGVFVAGKLFRNLIMDFAHNPVPDINDLSQIFHI